jgi:hypothetical protein
MSNNPNPINDLFNLLDKWRLLPAYQLERRADIFFGLFLPEILKEKFKVEIDHIIPEFPVRLGSIDGSANNQSYKIDYLAVSKSANRVFLIELKTDMNSRRTVQDNYLNAAKEMNITGLIDGLLLIYKASRHKTKYNYLLKELVEVGWIKITDSRRN